MFIVELSSRGAAAKAGVQNNDRLIEINGKNVENDTHEEVVEKVFVCILVHLLFWPTFTATYQSGLLRRQVWLI